MNWCRIIRHNWVVKKRLLRTRLVYLECARCQATKTLPLEQDPERRAGYNPPPDDLKECRTKRIPSAPPER